MYLIGEQNVLEKINKFTHAGKLKKYGMMAILDYNNTILISEYEYLFFFLDTKKVVLSYSKKYHALLS